MNQIQELPTPTAARESHAADFHPLEPLTAAEIEQAVALLRALPDWNPQTRIISITLKEPPKSAVYAWPAVPVTERRATAVVMDNQANRAATVTLDLAAHRVMHVQPAPEGAQPTISIDEQIECEQAVLASEEFRAALEKHYGITRHVARDGGYLERRTLWRRRSR